MKVCCAVTLLAALASTGCGNNHGLYPVSGKVMYKGEPAIGAYVLFQRPGIDPAKNQSIMGVVQHDGSFTVDYGAQGKGAPPGEYLILVRWKHDPTLPPARSPKESASRPDRLKGRYDDPKHPLLRTVVRAESNVVPTIQLQD
jgi:hypothetical protein